MSMEEELPSYIEEQETTMEIMERLDKKLKEMRNNLKIVKTSEIKGTNKTIEKLNKSVNQLKESIDNLNNNINKHFKLNKKMLDEVR